MVDAFTIAVAIVILVAVARWLGPVRPITLCVLALLTAAWVFANLRNSGWQEVLNEGTPQGLDPVTKAMFWRGWPLAPVMVCLIYGNRLRPSGLEGWTLVVDWFVLFLALSLARFLCERCYRRRNEALEFRGV
jgi:hypothetical protein